MACIANGGASQEKATSVGQMSVRWFEERRAMADSKKNPSAAASAAQPGTAADSAAQPDCAGLSLSDRRVAGNGEAYTFAEYVDYYGFQSALSLWQTNSAEHPVDTIVGHLESRAEHPRDINSAEESVGTIVSNPQSRAYPDRIHPQNSAEQPVRITASHPRGQDEKLVDVIANHIQDSAAQPVGITASQPEQQDILLSWVRGIDGVVRLSKVEG